MGERDSGNVIPQLWSFASPFDDFIQSYNERMKQQESVNVVVEPKNDVPPQVELLEQGSRKTEPCKYWKDNVVCPFGVKCHYAHGSKEQKGVKRHPRFRTVPCHFFFGPSGICRYGHRCHFSHD